VVPGQEYDVVLDLDACAYAFAPGQRIRLSIAGSDWPNTIAPPAPVTLTVHGGSLILPLWDAHAPDVPRFVPGAPQSSETHTGVGWTITRDVLAGTTTCSVLTDSEYDVPYGGTASEHYAGRVVVDQASFDQRAEAECSFALTSADLDARVESTMTVVITDAGYDVTIDATVHEGATVLAERSWHESLPR
jgi:hypothetical protein